MSFPQAGQTPLAKVPMAENEVVFQAPWEAKAFALVNQLASNGHCSWSEWTDCLAGEISASEQKVTDSKTYYELWMAACEKLLISKGLISAQAVEDRMQELIAAQNSEHDHAH